MTPTCFWDDTYATVLVSGVWLCANHACCRSCGKLVTEPVSCVCADYGASDHEEALFCSIQCLEASHPDRGEPDA